MVRRERREQACHPARWWLLVVLATAGGAALAQDLVRAAPAGLPPDVMGQALAYEHGEGVPKDALKAAALYCEAARDFNPDAQFNLGWMFFNGRGLPRNDAVAAALFASASAAGHAYAGRALALAGSERGALPDCMKNVVELRAVPILALQAVPSFAPIDPFGALPQWKQNIARVVAKLAPRYAVDPQLALAVVATESNFDPAARSPKDARGLMQLIPATAARFNVTDPYDVSDNLRGGLAYLRWLLAYYRGQVALAAAAYNAGEGAVDRYRGIPPYPETQEYVRRVLRLYGSERHPYDERVVEPSSILSHVKVGPT